VDSVTSEKLSGSELEQALMKGCDPFDCLDWIDLDLRTELESIQESNPNLLSDLPPILNWQQRIDLWILPKEYQELDIENHVLNLCRSSDDTARVEWELSRFKEKNLLPLLKSIKYLVDLMKKNQLVCGVGRGSSVSSLVLFLLGLHRIDPIKWNLDPAEFFR